MPANTWEPIGPEEREGDLYESIPFLDSANASRSGALRVTAVPASALLFRQLSEAWWFLLALTPSAAAPDEALFWRMHLQGRNETVSWFALPEAPSVPAPPLVLFLHQPTIIRPELVKPAFRDFRIATLADTSMQNLSARMRSVLRL